jgi:leader peptidase (prepilin peptidase)/N-methyltransferase
MFNRQIWAEVPYHFWTAVFFIFGSMVGSFLNVCIHRMPRGESVISPPSHCPTCGYHIPWFLNIPLLTWLFLRGRCANCRSPIAFRYFLVELITALACAAAWLHAGRHSTALALIYCLFLAGLIVAAFIDLEHLIIPDEITIGGVVTGLLFSLAVPALHDAVTRWYSLLQGALGAALGATVVYLVVRVGKLIFGQKHYSLDPDTLVIFDETGLKLPDQEIPYEDIFYRKTDTIVLQAKSVQCGDRHYEDVPVRLDPSQLLIGTEAFDPATVPRLEVVTDAITVPREAMGFGDVKFMAAVGAYLGWPCIVFSMVASSLLGAAVGGLMILYHRLRGRHYSTQIPYGPYIAAAAVLWLFWGRQITAWWFDLTEPPLG